MDLNQISIPATDLDRSLAFYKLLGLKLIVLNAPGYARFELPSGASTLSLHLEDSAPFRPLTLYFEVDDVDQKHRALCAAGVVFDTPPTDQTWRWREARFRDPAGNLLCLYHAGPDRRFPPWRLEQSEDSA